jgi:uncharacterized protein YdeI (BOF family)
MTKFIPATLLATACLLSSCGDKKADTSAPAQKEAAAAALPTSLFATAKPAAKALSVVEAKKLANGAEVTLIGDIGGSVKGVFNEKFAIFTLADETAITSCDKEEGDNCVTPWDYCCEDSKSMIASTLSVQIVDANGKVIKNTLRDANGLKELSKVVITGKIEKKGDATLVNASSIYIAK